MHCTVGAQSLKRLQNHITKQGKRPIAFLFKQIMEKYLIKQIMDCSSGKPKTALKVQTQNTTVNYSMQSNN